MNQSLGDAFRDVQIEMINHLFNEAQKSAKYTEEELKIIGKFCDNCVKDINKEREEYGNAVGK